MASLQGCCLPLELGQMSTAEIITEIDAYLLCLRRARQLLLGSSGIATRRATARKQAPIEAAKESSPTSAVARIRKVRARQRAAQRKNMGSETVGLVATADSMAAVQTKQLESNSTSPQLPVRESVPSSAEPNHSEHARDRYGRRQNQVTVSENAKPRNALSSATASRVVVVSPEEAQKARERAAHPLVRQQRVSGVRLTGRAAFEALFTNVNDSSVAPSA